MANTEGKGDRVANYHVMSREGGRWAVSREGGSKARRVFDRKEDAIRYARKLIDAEGSLYVHREDGWVDVKRSVVRVREAV